MSTSPSRQSDRGQAVKIIAGATVAVVLLLVIGLLWFLRDDSPADVSLDGAIETLEQSESDSESDAGTSTNDGIEGDDTSEGDDASEGDDDGGIAGIWTVDTESGDFDYESATGSFVGFRIEEELNSIGSTTAVGRTGDVAGTMVIEGSTVVEASFDIDMTTITTNSSMRDDNVQDALETGDFPSASFVLTEPIELGDGAGSGDAVSAVAVGDMTVHGVTNQVSFAIDAQLVNGVVIAVGSTEITFADYGVVVPNGGPVISVDDFGILELQLLLS